MRGARFAGLWAALAVICISLLGCAEINERGGILAYGGDKLVFPASGKGHRVLRSYVITGALASIARTKGIPGPEQASFYGSLAGSLDLSKEAFICAYQSTDGCIFFDEKMARLDYAIFKLAVQVLIDNQQKKLGTQIRDSLLGEIPILTPLSKVAANTVTSAGQIGKAASQTSDLLTAILELDYSGLITIGRITPLYRDAVEMDMRVLVDYLDRKCRASIISTSKAPRGQFADSIRGHTNDAACLAFLNADDYYHDGNGRLSKWREYITGDYVSNILPYVTPSADHFIAVSNVIVGACTDINEKYAKDCVAKVLFASEAKAGKAYERAIAAATKLARGEDWTECTTAANTIPKFPECQMMAGSGTKALAAPEPKVPGAAAIGAE
jgi:hypothetical protein